MMGRPMFALAWLFLRSSNSHVPERGAAADLGHARQGVCGRWAWNVTWKRPNVT